MAEGAFFRPNEVSAARLSSGDRYSLAHERMTLDFVFVGHEAEAGETFPGACPCRIDGCPQPVRSDVIYELGYGLNEQIVGQRASTTFLHYHQRMDDGVVVFGCHDASDTLVVHRGEVDVMRFDGIPWV